MAIIAGKISLVTIFNADATCHVDSSIRAVSSRAQFIGVEWSLAVNDEWRLMM